MQDIEEVSPCRPFVFQGPRRRRMANLFKAYSYDEDNYIRSMTDNFDRKAKVLLERCDQVDIAEEYRNRAFSIIFSGNAH